MTDDQIPQRQVTTNQPHGLGAGYSPEAQGLEVTENTQVMAPRMQPGNSWSEAFKQLPQGLQPPLA